MSVTTELLDKIKENHKLENNNQLAKFLDGYIDTGRQKINNYYNQGRQIDMTMVVVISEILGIDTVEIISKLSIENTKSGKNKDFFKKKLEDITPCILYSFTGFMSFFASVEHYILCEVTL